MEKDLSILDDNDRRVSDVLEVDKLMKELTEKVHNFKDYLSKLITEIEQDIIYKIEKNQGQDLDNINSIINNAVLKIVESKVEIDKKNYKYKEAKRIEEMVEKVLKKMKEKDMDSSKANDE